MNDEKIERIEFTKEMKKDYTILIPNMLDVHFKLLLNVFRSHGYKMELLNNSDASIITNGLKYVHNDTCYPALVVIGQMLDALNSGKYDLNKTALMITQTGGGCRASNYIHLLRKSLVKAGMGHVPVISLNLAGLEKNGGFKFTLPMIRKAAAALAYGDLMMLMKNQIIPYEVKSGSAEAAVEKWVKQLSGNFERGKGYKVREMKSLMDEIAADFAAIERANVGSKVRVGIVGEIFVEYSPVANNGLEKFLVEQGCESMTPGIMNFMLFKTDNRLEDIKLYGGSVIKYKIVNTLLKYLKKIEQTIIDAVKRYPQFTTLSPYEETKKEIDGVIGYGSKMGEGWLLTADMLDLTAHGYGNIICAQPFGCLPNHIVGKGMIRKVKSIDPRANIVPIDYDPGATKVNQENRIKLMLAVASERMRGCEDARGCGRF
jgi:predicted nucleotide-binding protein (sugar kinase/HSP70/actin superfamily)